MEENPKKEMEPITMGDADNSEYEHAPIKIEAISIISKVSDFLEIKFKDDPYKLQLHGADMVARLLGGEVVQGEIDVFLLTMKDGEAVQTGWAGGGNLLHRWVEKDGYVIDGFLDEAVRNAMDREFPRQYAPIPIIIRQGRTSSPVDVLYSNAKTVPDNTVDALFEELEQYLANRQYPENLKGNDLEGILDERGLKHAGRYWVWAQGAFYTDHHGELPTRKKSTLNLTDKQEITPKEKLSTETPQVKVKTAPQSDIAPEANPNDSEKHPAGMAIDSAKTTKQAQDIGNDIIEMTKKKPLKIVPTAITIGAGVGAAYIISMVF